MKKNYTPNMISLRIRVIRLPFGSLNFWCVSMFATHPQSGIHFNFNLSIKQGHSLLSNLQRS
jgi:hypothetical protein